MVMLVDFSLAFTSTMTTWAMMSNTFLPVTCLTVVLRCCRSLYPMALALAAIVAVFLKHQMGAVAPAPHRS